MQRGSAFVVTASLAGLTAMPSDPVYTLTKHAVVGFVRAVAPQLEPRGIRINAVCPGIVDTPMLDKAGQRAAFASARFPLLQPQDVADAVLLAAQSELTGQAWAVQPGREPLQFRFANVPGPRVEGAEGTLPPL
jgi:NAD(P)-dependent dehydrogenase (short-subunit alcohol dehydrogenase family)